MRAGRDPGGDAAVLIAGLGTWFGAPALWFERARVVLMAASPCAPAISVPVAVLSPVGGPEPARGRAGAGRRCRHRARAPPRRGGGRCG
ncbi:hypothetical protein DSY14_15405 [Nocardiopsis sp. MG754419]|nr:hypothetical protein [Nocardiopsis sp. MG754419]